MKDSSEKNPCFPCASPGEAGPLTNCTKLLDYVAFLENELESLKLQSHASQSIHQEERTRLLERLETALDKMDETEGELQGHKESEAFTQSAVEHLKHELCRTERLLQEEHQREKILEDRIQKLELEVEMKTDLINHRRKRDERARKKLEKENEILKKKATLGWMLGCLSEVYVQSEPEGAAAPLLKMVRNIQRELERENVVLSYSNEPPQMHLAYVEKEIRRLIDCARLAESEAEPSLSKGSDQAQLVKSVPSTQRSLLEESDSAGCFNVNSVASDSEDTLKEKSVAKPVLCRTQGSDSPNPRIHEEGGSPNARFIINCFGGDSARNAEIGNNRTFNDVELNVARDQCGASKIPSPHAQIEMFEANPEADVEHTRLTGSTWAEVKVMNKGEAEAAGMLHCQSDIKRMLSRLEASMEHLLQQQQLLPEQPQQGTQVLDRSIGDLDSMILSEHGNLTKSKGAAHRPIRKHSPAITKHGTSASRLKSSTKH